MKKLSNIALVILFTCSLISAHVATLQAEEPAPLRVFASKAIANRVQHIVDRYKAENPTQLIIVTGGLVSKGFPLFYEGHVDLVISSRLMNPQEKAMAHEKENYKVLHRQCAGFMIAVIVHPENRLQEISLLDLARIYAGKVTNWNQIGGADKPIHVLGRHYPKEGIAVTFTEAIMKGKPLYDSISLRDYDHMMILSVSSTRGSIGYVRSDAVNKNKVKILALKQDGLEQPLLPVSSNLKDGSYPIIGKFTVYWNDRSPRASSVVKFADYCCRWLANTPSSR